MSEYADCEAGVGADLLAWRLFTVLEGGALLLGGLALLVHTVRLKRQACPKNSDRTTESPVLKIRHVLISEEKSKKGRELATKLRSNGCRVSSLSEETSGAEELADAFIVFGTSNRCHGLDGLANVVSKDIYSNITLLQRARDYVRLGGRLIWVSGANTTGAFEASAVAFDNVLRAQLQRIADDVQCEAIWVESGDPSTLTNRVLDAVLATRYSTKRESEMAFNLRTATTRISLALWRWLKSFA